MPWRTEGALGEPGVSALPACMPFRLWSVPGSAPPRQTENLDQKHPRIRRTAVSVQHSARGADGTLVVGGLG